MLTEKDLVFHPYDKAILKTIKDCPASTIRKLVRSWLGTPELQPVNKLCQYKDYVGLTIKEIYPKIQEDWSDGLRAVQIAQIELKAIATDENLKRKWKVFRALKEDKGRLNLDNDAVIFQETFDRFLAQTFECYLYTIHDKKTDLHWMRIHITSEINGVNPYSSPKTAFLAFCPHTEFVMLTGKSLPINLDNYIREAILDTFSADKLLMQVIRGRAAKHLEYVVETRKSKGVFSELRTNLNYSNPLSVRQEPTFEDEETYVDKGEQSRRIKAINQDEIDARLKSIAENFARDEMFGKTVFSREVSMPMQMKDDDGDDDLQPVIYDITLKGENISNGLRAMISHGQIKTPIPKWLAKIGTSY
ncbi:centromere protein Chl4/mis15/CENP-N [Parasitella parasitica]|nr:centromere protein Chl4/mis15/CENP-N [Parasitella parasitica]